MEELARTSTSIADTVARVAGADGDTRAVLEDADRDIQRSSERTLALAERVGEISGAARADQRDRRPDEPARAQRGDRGGAGRRGGPRLHASSPTRCAAWRSARRRSAADIAEIIESTQDETNATVMAMEQSSKQMQRGLDLMDSVAEPTDQVRLTTQQQGAATQQVVDDDGDGHRGEPPDVRDRAADLGLGGRADRARRRPAARRRRAREPAAERDAGAPAPARRGLLRDGAHRGARGAARPAITPLPGAPAGRAGRRSTCAARSCRCSTPRALLGLGAARAPSRSWPCSTPSAGPGAWAPAASRDRRSSSSAGGPSEAARRAGASRSTSAW